MEKLIFKRCPKCGNLFKVMGELKCEGVTCCGDHLETLTPNSTDASFEKHVPTFEIDNDKLIVTVNHVMDEDHFIEWICFQTEDKEQFVYLDKEAKAEFPYEKGILYAYCNKRGLWASEVE